METEKKKSPLPVPITKFAWQIAGIREIIINLVINSIIPLWVYSKQDQVPLWGWHGLIVVLGPMSMLLPWLTSFFGVLAGSLSRIGGAVLPRLDPKTRWVGFAVRLATLRTLIVSPIVWSFVYLLSKAYPEWSMSSRIAVFSLCFGSAIVAYLFHATAIISTLRWSKEELDS